MGITSGQLLRKNSASLRAAEGSRTTPLSNATHRQSLHASAMARVCELPRVAGDFTSAFCAREPERAVNTLARNVAGAFRQNNPRAGDWMDVHSSPVTFQ